MNSETHEFLHGKQLLQEAEETLRAIRYGTVDAFVIQEAEGHRVYTLEGSDLPYSTLVERMQQGAAMLDGKGCIVYCNLSLAQLMGVPRETVVGQYLQDLLAPADQAACRRLLQEAQTATTEGEMHLRIADGNVISANFSFTVLSRDKSATGVLVTDLTMQKQQMEFASRLQHVQDEERKRIARDLHDSVGQLLAAIGMNVALVQSQSHKLDAEAARAVADNAMLVQRASVEIRTISHLLHPPLLDVAGLASAIRWYVDGFSERSHIKVDLRIPDHLGRMPVDMEIAIFRMIQECLTNIHRHSGSATAAISLKQDGDLALVEVRDSGKGIPLDKQREFTELGRGGVGLNGMRERLRQLGGTLEIQSKETGTVVTATLPVKQAAA
jgi:PAS domain S-box-containing protein